MVTKKQHYVPQFLLNNFCLMGSDRKISTYRISEAKHLSRSTIRDQAHENNFYGDQETEAKFAGLEGEAARIIREAIRTETLPAPRSSDHHALLTFTIAQVFRTRAAADVLDELTDNLAKRLMAEVPKLKDHLDKFEVKVVGAPLQTLGTALTQIGLVRDLRYKLLCNRTDIPFILSDNPAVMYNQYLEPRKRTGSNTGLAIKGLQILLPFGPRHLLLFFDTDIYYVGTRRLSTQRVDITSDAEIRSLNLLQAVNARECLYFNDKISVGEVNELAKKAAKFREVHEAKLIEYQPASGDLKNDGVLLRQFKPDVRTRLHLSCVRLTPHAEQYDPRGRLIHYRDPEFVKIHNQFVKGVYAGKYQVGDLNAYLLSIMSGRTPEV